MNAIIKFALKSAFSNSVNIDTLLEILNATENPEVATEKLLGLYEEPTFRKTRTDREGITETFESYDPFKRKVHFSYESPSEVTKYYSQEKVLEVFGKEYMRTAEVKAQPSLFFDERSEAEKAYPNDTIKYGWFSLGKMRKRTNSCSPENWQEK